MKTPRILWFYFVLVSLLGIAPNAHAAPGPTITPGACVDGKLPSKALSRVCVPSKGWNNDLVIWAHGYIDATRPLGIYHLELEDGTSLPDLVQSLGFAFATTSYRQNGLTIQEGRDDIRELVAAFRAKHGTPRRTYLLGASEGGLITTLLAEQSPDLFSGGVAACGPIGDFGKQVNHIGDFRVLWDALFPGVLPRWTPQSPKIPAEVIKNWDTKYVPAITKAVNDNPDTAQKLIATSRAAIDPAEPTSVVSTTVHLLWYSAFASNDLLAKFGGNPFNNPRRIYVGSGEDVKLNREVARFTADPATLAKLAPYTPTGKLTIPLVTLHTTGDELVPFWHELLYKPKVETTGRGKFTAIPVKRYGHCSFSKGEALTAFGLLVLQVTGQRNSAIDQIIADDAAYSAQAAQPAAITPGTCVDGKLPSKALSRQCVPTKGWNKDLVVYAHGYVNAALPLDFYQITLDDGTSLPDLVQSLGFAFATTSYRQNGLAIQEGVGDIRELVTAFRAKYGTPRRTYLIGASEGGLIATLLSEQSPELFSGTLALCAPIGDFNRQINYLGDFRALFDAFFPGIVPRWTSANPLIPASVMKNWQTQYVPQVAAAVRNNPDATAKLLRTGLAPSDAKQPTSALSTTLTLLTYNIFGTNDAAQKLGGSTFDNGKRIYLGSGQDGTLNREVARFKADPAASAKLGAYTPTGNLTIPLVTLHTTRDELVPFWHELLYKARVQTTGRGKLTVIPIERYGHCAFEKRETLSAFGVLVLQVSGQRNSAIDRVVETDALRRE